MKQKPENLHSLAKQYGWKFIPLVFLILFLAPFRCVAFILNQFLVKFLEVTDV